MTKKSLLTKKKYLLVALLVVAIAVLNWQGVFANFSGHLAQKSNYQVERNIVYQTVDNQQLKLDVYENKQPGLHPVLMVIHGGGWIKGSKEGEKYFFNPYLRWGFSVVNINYRLAKTATAPAAVEDAICALNWLQNHATKYNFDTDQIVLTGFSAGGHLALTTGMINNVNKFNRNCADAQPKKVAAIINWSGITDVADLLVGKNQKYFAVEWLGNKTSAAEIEIAKSISPINLVRPDLPPILTVHGEKDTFVPYSHGTRLHQALTQVGTVNQLFTVKGAAHGGFSPKQKQEIYAMINRFLKQQQIIDRATL